MKKGLLFIPAVALLAGCASNAEYYAAMVEINAKRAEVEAVKADSQSQRINALVQMAEQGDEATKASATMALALMNSNNGDEKDFTAVTPEAPRNQVLDWASVLLPFTGQVVTGYMNYNLGKVQSNNSVRLAESEHEAFTELGIGAYREGNAPRYRPDDSYDLGEGRELSFQPDDSFPLGEGRELSFQPDDSFPLGEGRIEMQEILQSQE